MKAAEQLRLPRLAATINNERVRLRMLMTPAVSARLRTPRTIPRGEGPAGAPALRRNAHGWWAGG